MAGTAGSVVTVAGADEGDFYGSNAKRDCRLLRQRGRGVGRYEHDRCGGIRAGAGSALEGRSMGGVVTAVSRSATHTMSKPNEGSIRLLAGLGVEGDAHRARRSSTARGWRATRASPTCARST